MSEDGRVKGRSDEEVRAIAESTKLEYRVERRRPVNILRCLRSGSIPTLYGRKNLVFKVVDDEELGSKDARTDFSDNTVTITVKRSVQDRAEMGVGRDRMTLAHELGHGVMHYGDPKFRGTGATGVTELSQDKAYESAEHQAKVFAATFLIHDEDAAKLLTASEISVEFGVSLLAAELCFERLRRKEERAKSAERVQKINQEIKTILLGPPKHIKPSYLNDLCVSCKQATLIPIGDKVLCECGFVGSRFQDGDEAT